MTPGLVGGLPCVAFVPRLPNLAPPGAYHWVVNPPARRGQRAARLTRHIEFDHGAAASARRPLV